MAAEPVEGRTIRPPKESSSLPSPAERRQRNREEVRSAIVETARAVMREQGVAALSLREVARRVHMQAPSLYAYFPSKMALYDALFLLAVRLRAEYRDRADAGLDDFWDRLRTRFETYMRFAQENPELYQLAFERPVPGFVPSAESLEEAFRAPAAFEQFLAEAVASGQIVLDMPVVQARDLLIGMIHGLTAQHMANEPELPIGSGRFGSQIPTAVALFRAKWDPRGANPGARGKEGPDRQLSGRTGCTRHER
ncbi:MAG TPA: TetR/AcrR family transcriptional regulator [Thermomicrobiales bacterium]|nr:TetR/AcrR family transcriptional regulator [Thermomicrobiales bacterium]